VSLGEILSENATGTDIHLAENTVALSRCVSYVDLTAPRRMRPLKIAPPRFKKTPRKTDV